MKRNNKKRADSKEKDAKSKVQFIALICIVYGLIGTIKGTYFDVDNDTYRAKGEVVDVYENRIIIQEERKSFVLDNSKVCNTIRKGDYAEIWYEEIKPKHDGSEIVLSDDGLISSIEQIRVIKRVVQLKINGEMVYKYNWFKKNKIPLLFFISGILAIFRRPKTKDDDNEPTDIEYKEQSIINEDNLVYDSDMDYSVYKAGDKEIISVVFNDENGAYCRYFTLPDTAKGEDYSQLADLANDIRSNAANYAENEIFDA